MKLTDEHLDRYARRLKAKLDYLLMIDEQLFPRACDRPKIISAYEREKTQDWRYTPHPSEAHRNSK